MRPLKRILVLPGSAGFTLAELLVVIAVLGLVLAGLVLLQQGLQAYVGAASHMVGAQQDARVAVDLMGRELRQACAITASPAPTATTIEFTIVDPAAAAAVDCSVTGSLLTVQYALLGATLTRTVGGDDPAAHRRGDGPDAHVLRHGRRADDDGGEHSQRGRRAHDPRRSAQYALRHRGHQRE